MASGGAIAGLADWRDFFAMVGTSAAGLLGATFVVATLTAGVEKRVTGFRGFITPMAVHLGTVVVVAAILTIPTLSLAAFSLLIGIGGVAGMLYALVVIVRIWSLNLDLSDRAFYAFFPIFAYAAMTTSAPMIHRPGAPALEVLAAALVLFLVIGMRNAWDMATFLILGGGQG